MVVHVGGAPLPDVQAMARHAALHGATAIATLPPLYDPPATLEDLLDYLTQVASAAPDTPLLYYHIPCKTSVVFPMDELLEAGHKRIPTLAGLKFTSHDVATEGKRCLKAAGGEMCVLTGFDQSLSESRRLGFPGVINGSFNLVPLEVGRLFCLADPGAECPCLDETARGAEVAKLQAKIDAMWAAISKHAGPYTAAGAKAAMALITGLDVGPPRAPVRALTAGEQRLLRKDLLAAGYDVEAMARRRSTSKNYS